MFRAKTFSQTSTLKSLSVGFSAIRHWIGFSDAGTSATQSIYSLRENKKRDQRGTHSLSSEVEIMSEYERDQPQDDRKNVEKDAALNHALSRLAGDFGKDSMLSLQQFSRSRNTHVISSGSLKLDLALGIGGLPKGRIIEIYGREASGKTTVALQIVKEAQKLGGYCAYFDAENAIDPSFAEAVGVNTDTLLIARANSAENSLSAVDTLIRCGSVDVIVVDSVAALVPQCELDGVIGGTLFDSQSRLITQALRKIQHSLCRSQTLVIFVNQVRSNVKSSQVFGYASEVTCGGNALKFHAAIRLRIMKRGLIVVEDEIAGIGISVQVVKNKLAPAMRKAELDICFGKGICREAEVLELACKHGVISKEGNIYYIDGETFRDKLEVEQYLAVNDGVLDELVRHLRIQLFGMS
ncbi:DNA repair protein recA homolog 2, mitochondrial isoform X1 [Aristolochia californica]|uniref:DNA repair protein recA homolog 2, mitochondrial isoform X1 n=1 Tax=Aristolochia californica TaxID=171875 RepID=UPI0035D7D5B2